MKNKKSPIHSTPYSTSPYIVYKKGGNMNIPKYAFGTILGSASLGLNVFNSIKAMENAKLASLTAKNNRNAQLLEEDRLIMEDYPIAGNEDVTGFYKKGGKIYIKPENKGKFTAFAKRKGMGVQEAASTVLANKDKYNSTIVKRANFAKNAVNWKHAIGGTIGGDLEQLSSDTTLADGNTHEQSKIDNTSGIKLLDNTGNIVAEIEDGEVIKDDQLVFSDRLKSSTGRTYAESAKKLGKEKGKLEEELKDQTTGIRKNTIMTKLANIEKKENRLFTEQELSKSFGGKMKYACGGKMKKMEDGGIFQRLEKALPYLDNFTNAILTATTPNQDFPQLARPRKLKTDFNVSPQLRNVTDTINQITKGIRDTTASSNTANERETAVKLAGIREKNSILANKENVETQLENQNIGQQQQIEAQNLSRIKGFKDQQLSRAYNIQGRISGNVANLVEDINKKQAADSTEKYQNEQLDVIRDTYDVDGTSKRADLNNPIEIDYLKSNPVYRELQAKRYLAKDSSGNYTNPNEAEQFLKLFPQYK